MSGTFLLLDRRAGWRAGAASGVTVERGLLELSGLPDAAALTDPAGTLGGLSLPTGVAVDAAGDVYALDGDLLALLRYDRCVGSFVALPCFGGRGTAPRRLLEPRGLAVSPRGDAYVVDGGNRRVQVLALKGLPLRRILGPLVVVRAGEGVSVRPAAAPPDGRSFPEHTWDPWDVAVAAGGRVYVSDRAEGLVHVFDLHGRWRAAFDRDGETGRLERPTALAVDRDGRLYVVQEAKDYIVVLNADGSFARRIRRPAEAVASFEPVSLAVDADGNLWIADRGAGAVHLYRPVGREARHVYSGSCGALGTVGGVAVGTTGPAVVGDADAGAVVRLLPAAAYAGEGTFWSAALDSEVYRCQWHRIQLDADVPPGTRVTVHTFTAESEKELEEIRDLPDERWATAQTDTGTDGRRWDCLVTSPAGRFLWLRLELAGGGTSTPAIERIELHYPRRSSLDFLPAVYSEDPAAADLTARFLSIFDTLRDGVADTIAGVARTFDPRATPAGGDSEPDFLAWLAGWLDLALEASWPEEKRRLLVASAHRLYALRGTPEGLCMHIRLYADLEPTILEHFRLRKLLLTDRSRLDACAVLWGRSASGRLQLDEGPPVGRIKLLDNGDPRADPLERTAHHFSVFVPKAGVATPDGRRALERIIEQAKPAHTAATLALLDPGLRVGVQGFVGVDTMIGRYPEGITLGAAGSLGRDTVLGAAADETAPPYARVGVRVRIGSTTRLD